ncbi:Stp1/IreP family PP2C-type Ser/Thr phosphatase [Solimicrobium silvestre]|uniref:Serine/threonine protein phosphatase n=1 Tax=Solimicrobium silvestre TaxID=2099400 RepID=A0A2S9GTF7_9BURK|nr:Stp1/IreP family PP2C-type Ser/Thr phosphatase [Solimicrobium silvestre]PRC91004.1 Serine/threonine protein phosphatase [Solimicrobium silvestre]
MPNSDSIDYASQTDTGLKRVHNEDAIAVCPESAMTILADGMGGYNAGEVASEIAITVIKDYVNEKLHRFLSHLIPYQPDDLQLIVEQAIELANNTILQAALTEPQYFGMGTTLVMSVCYRDILVVAHVGDSRAYRYRQGQLTQITHDHSVVQEQIDAGMISVETAQYSDIKNLVTRAVGVSYPVETEVNLHQVEIGDVYLLCSDGLSDMLSAQKIQETLQQDNVNIQDMCAELIRLANEEGGRDNISVILFKINSIKNFGLKQLF